MHRIRTATVALLSTVALTVGAAPLAAHADKPDREPCAKQETQVQKAEDALARVTALQATKVKKEKVAKTKKAQQMRLAKAHERLTACETAGTGTTP
jgi:CHASE2 domain-containing sensor protein